MARAQMMERNADRFTVATAERAHPRLEFGGSLGALAIILASHALVYYLWLSVTYHRAQVIPLGLLFSSETWQHLRTGAAPTLHAALLYLGFLALQLLLARTMPGVTVQGLPVPSEGNRKYSYLCNGAASWFDCVTIWPALMLGITAPNPTP